jgi:hypothetical protein
LPGRLACGGRPAGANPKQQLDGDLLRWKTLLETFKAANDAVRATERPAPGLVTAAAASRNDGTNDLLVDDLRANEPPERR